MSKVGLLTAFLHPGRRHASNGAAGGDAGGSDEGEKSWGTAAAEGRKWRVEAQVEGPRGGFAREGGEGVRGGGTRGRQSTLIPQASAVVRYRV